MITSAVTEPKQPEALPQPTATAQPVAEKPVKPAPIVTSPGATAPVAATATPSEKKKEKKGATETRPTEGQPKVNAPKEPRVKAVASDSPTEISEAKGTIYNVQVRATTDQAEADLVVKRLKRKGFGNVTILQSEKNGAPFFRIRFGSFTSKEEATAAAGSSGYSGTWVVRQR
jgi:septal ring-binding cell division protein DamX